MVEVKVERQRVSRGGKSVYWGSVDGVGIQVYAPGSAQFLTLKIEGLPTPESPGKKPKGKGIPLPEEQAKQLLGLLQALQK